MVANDSARHVTFINPRTGREVNIAKLILSRALSCRNAVLKSMFRFNQWHVRATYFDRPYKKAVVRMTNSVRPEVVVEVGSGLGEIISRVQAQQRFGFDVDKGVIAAATFLGGRNTTYKYGSIAEGTHIADALCQAGAARVDALILVNWIHELPFDHIMSGVIEIHKRVPIGHLVVDAIKAGVPGYQYHHAEEDFAKYGRILESVEGDAVRSLHLLALDDQTRGCPGFR